MKERQTSLIEETKFYDMSKKDKLEHIYKNLKYDKIITYFGNINSKVVILGIAPIQKHVDSESETVFCFDINLEQTGQSSGAILLKVFKELTLNIKDFFFDNIFKIPIERLTEEDKQIFREKMDKELEILECDTIICLGSDCYSEIKKFYTNVNKSIRKIPHPGYILRGGMNIEQYIKMWKEVLLEERVLKK